MPRGHCGASVVAAPIAAAQGQFGNLIFGFAVTEALGIFSLLIALLLLVRPVTNCEARASPPRGRTASPPEPAMADEHATMTGATPPSEHGGGPAVPEGDLRSQLFWLVVCLMSPLLWYLPFVIMSGACETIYRTDEVRTDHRDKDEEARTDERLRLKRLAVF